MEEKTATEEVIETFGKTYQAIQRYCEWVMANCFVLDLIESKKEQIDLIEGLPIMDLEMRL